MLKVLEKYTKKLLIGNKITADMNNILTMLVRCLKNYFFISEEEMNELEIASKIAINKANQNFQYSDNKYFRGGIIVYTQ